MAGTFSQIYIQLIFAVKNRECLVKHEWEERLYQYVTGIIREKEQKLLAINGMPDHIHLFIGMKPTRCLSDLVREVKKASNEFINDNRFVKGHFRWQEGYGAFSYSHSQLDAVVKYVLNQKEHHRKKTFREEYLDFLNRFHVVYDEKYLFEWLE